MFNIAIAIAIAICYYPYPICQLQRRIITWAKPGREKSI